MIKRQIIMKNTWNYCFTFLLMVSSSCYSRHTYSTSKSFTQEPVYRNSIKPLLQGPDKGSPTDSKSIIEAVDDLYTSFQRTNNNSKHVLADSSPMIFPDFEVRVIPDDTKNVLNPKVSKIKSRMTSDTKDPPTDTVEMVFPNSEEYSVPIHRPTDGRNELSGNVSQRESRLSKSQSSSSTENKTTPSESKGQFIPIFLAVNEHSSKDSKLISQFFDMEKFKITVTKSKMYSEDKLLEILSPEEISTPFNSPVETTTEASSKYVQNENYTLSNSTPSDLTTEHYLLIFPGHKDFVPLDNSTEPYIPPSKVGDKEYLANRLKKPSITAGDDTASQNSTTIKPDEEDKYLPDVPSFDCPGNASRANGVCRDWD